MKSEWVSPFYLLNQIKKRQMIALAVMLAVRNDNV
jgi:hypothetical protein